MREMPWFRLYHRIINDDKLLALAFEDRWHFIALCCLKAEGLLDKDRNETWMRRVALKMGLSTLALEEVARRLREVELIDETMSPVAWDELQMRSDASTERVRAFRERQRNQGVAVVKRDETVSETAQEKEKERDTEEEEEKNIKTRVRAKRNWVECPDDVDAAVWSAFAKIRKTPFTDIALQGFRREADKAGWTLQAAITEAAERGWQGFKAEWVKEKTNGRNYGTGDTRDGFTQAIDRRLHAGNAARPARTANA